METRMRCLYPSEGDFLNELKRIGVDPYALEIFEKKREVRLIKIEGCRIEAANIIKQDALSVGADAVLPRSAISGKPEKTDIILMGTLRNLEKLSRKLEQQPFGLKQIARALLHPDTPPAFFRARGKEIGLSTPLVMGILNVTPDSFYDGGHHTDEVALKNRIRQLIEEGADLIDIGGESTRPGSREVSPSEEWERIERPLALIREKAPEIPVSVDTRKSYVARKALENGADIINDVSALSHDPEMAPTAASFKAAVILMHMKGTPDTMQENPCYEDVTGEVYAYLAGRTEEARKSGIAADSLLIDPGIGFGKRLEDNTALLRRLREFKSLPYPLVMGLSRKSFLGTLTGRPPAGRLWGTVAAHAVALGNGADILRVHDVAAARDAVRVIRGIYYDKKE
ncbi:MAG TPA: dihydropteroate synthase [Candidatus Mcinerneyibacteriales bacterium]|nr:dihydropteroate synthase [Candidatus Mcinerneyibacteriales bacterium]